MQYSSVEFLEPCSSVLYTVVHFLNGTGRVGGIKVLLFTPDCMVAVEYVLSDNTVSVLQ